MNNESVGESRKELVYKWRELLKKHKDDEAKSHTLDISQFECSTELNYRRNQEVIMKIVLKYFKIIIFYFYLLERPGGKC